MRVKTMMIQEGNTEQVREDLLRWRRKLQKQRDYANQKIKEIDVALAGQQLQYPIIMCNRDDVDVAKEAWNKGDMSHFFEENGLYHYI